MSKQLTLDQQRKRRVFNKKKQVFLNWLTFFIIAVFAVIFLLPTVLTITNSFMSTTEISANYGQIFSNASSDAKTYISDKVNLKFIPDMVSFGQYKTAFITSPAYLLKFWNSVILTIPIVVGQIIMAAGASYCFARNRSKLMNAIFFVYVILMLMPYQVTLVPNFLVAEWLHIKDTYWSIILPGIFAPFSVFILTKFMRRIPVSVVEAAKLDGAGEFRIFTQIFLPLCKGTIYSVAILVFIDYWNMVEQPLIMLDDTETYPLSVFLSEVNTNDAGLAFAVATVYMIPALLIFLYSEDYLVEGIAYSGGIKG
ncbi:MAG: carbohydrate ABC transporter permease [Clostridia bacterium]|nr:carbohydrate ABC transporter permease [Clostridia bacterium]